MASSLQDGVIGADGCAWRGACPVLKSKLTHAAVSAALTLTQLASVAQAGPQLCERAFRGESEALYNARLDLPQSASVGPVANMPIRDVILRFLSGVPFPKSSGLTLGTRELLDLWQKPDQVPNARWAAASPLILQTALSVYGPFGAYGPLGLRQAPLGLDAGSPWFWWRKMVANGVWQTAPKMLFDKAGPLNPETGVLSQLGPDSKAWKQGVLDIFGTNSPLGPKGPLGVLGPMGAILSARALQLDGTGVYLDPFTKEIVNSILMPDHTGGKGPIDLVKYDIVNDLSRNYTRELSEAGLLDTSFMTNDRLDRNEQMQSFGLTARNSETVNALVIPDRGFLYGPAPFFVARPLNFSIEVRTPSGNLVVKSDLTEHVNLVHLQVRAGEKYEIRILKQGVELPGTEQNFRLVVTGSTSYYAKKLWDEELGPTFSDVMAMESDYDRELALNYIWGQVIEQAYENFDQIRGNSEFLKALKSRDYWAEELRTAVAKYGAIRAKTARPELARAELLSQMKSSLDRYEALIRSRNFEGSEILALYFEMWQGNAGTAENHFNLTADQAARVPYGWLEMLRKNYGLLAVQPTAGVVGRQKH